MFFSFCSGQSGAISAFVVETKTSGFTAGPKERKWVFAPVWQMHWRFDNFASQKKTSLAMMTRIPYCNETLDAGRLGLERHALRNERIIGNEHEICKRKEAIRCTAVTIPGNSIYALRHINDNLCFRSMVYRTAQDYDEKKSVPGSCICSCMHQRNSLK